MKQLQKYMRHQLINWIYGKSICNKEKHLLVGYNKEYYRVDAFLNVFEIKIKRQQRLHFN